MCSVGQVLVLGIFLSICLNKYRYPEFNGVDSVIEQVWSKIATTLPFCLTAGKQFIRCITRSTNKIIRKYFQFTYSSHIIPTCFHTLEWDVILLQRDIKHAANFAGILLSPQNPLIS